MIKYAEEMEDRKNCTFSCHSRIAAEALLGGLGKAGVTTYDPIFSDGTLSFKVDDCYYIRVTEMLKIFGNDIDA